MPFQVINKTPLNSSMSMLVIKQNTANKNNIPKDFRKINRLRKT
jgi:hypothetical protein